MCFGRWNEKFGKVAANWLESLECFVCCPDDPRVLRSSQQSLAPSKVLISDLALAGILPPPGNKLLPCGSPGFASMAMGGRPGIHDYEVEQCGPKQDVWACGCLLYILLSAWANWVFWWFVVCWFICWRKKNYSARSQSLSEAGHASVYPAARRLQWCPEVVACRWRPMRFALEVLSIHLRHRPLMTSKLAMSQSFGVGPVPTIPNQLFPLAMELLALLKWLHSVLAEYIDGVLMYTTSTYMSSCPSIRIVHTKSWTQCSEISEPKYADMLR